MSSNRNPCKQYFLTIPRTTGLFLAKCYRLGMHQEGISKEELAFLLESEVSINYYKIVKESHQDGGKHLHALIILKKGVSKTNMLKIFKRNMPLDFKRVDIHPTKNLNASLDYLDKEDPFPLENIPYNEYNPKKRLCDSARKCKYYNKILTDFNQLFNTKFPSGISLYEFFQHNKMSGKVPDFGKYKNNPNKKK